MTRAQATSEYVVEFANREDGGEYKYQCLFWFRKPLSEIWPKAEAINKFFTKDVSGVDGVKVLGLYCVELLFAKTFEPDDVVASIAAKLPSLYSEVIAPNREIITG